MPGRMLSNSEQYRYGFNGMEKDDDWYGAGNEYTTEFRQLDVRTGRWMSMDPMMAIIPGHSPYEFAFNNPILFTDPSGLFPGLGKGKKGGGDIPTRTPRYRHEDSGGSGTGSDSKGGAGFASSIKSVGEFCLKSIKLVLAISTNTAGDDIPGGNRKSAEVGFFNNSNKGNLALIINTDGFNWHNEKNKNKNWDILVVESIEDADDYISQYKEKGPINNLLIFNHGIGGELVLGPHGRLDGDDIRNHDLAGYKKMYYTSILYVTTEVAIEGTIIFQACYGGSHHNSDGISGPLSRAILSSGDRDIYFASHRTLFMASERKKVAWIKWNKGLGERKNQWYRFNTSGRQIIEGNIQVWDKGNPVRFK